MVAAMRRTALLPPLLLVVAAAGVLLRKEMSAEGAPPAAASSARPPYRDPAQPLDRRVADLLGRMTLAEKVAQLEAVNWDHTHVYDEKTRIFSLDRAKKVMPDGIGEVTRPAAGLDAHQAAVLANAVQRFLVEGTRLGIPAI